jgi:hypothetical protein
MIVVSKGQQTKEIIKLHNKIAKMETKYYGGPLLSLGDRFNRFIDDSVLYDKKTSHSFTNPLFEKNEFEKNEFNSNHKIPNSGNKSNSNYEANQLHNDLIYPDLSTEHIAPAVGGSRKTKKISRK